MWCGRGACAASGAAAAAAATSAAAAAAATPRAARIVRLLGADFARGLHVSACAAQAGAKKKPAGGGGGGGGGGAGGAAAPAAGEEKFDLTRVVPVNLRKDGTDPELQAESAYPPWLFALLDDKPILADQVQKGCAAGGGGARLRLSARLSFTRARTRARAPHTRPPAQPGECARVGAQVGHPAD